MKKFITLLILHIAHHVYNENKIVTDIYHLFYLIYISFRVQFSSYPPCLWVFSLNESYTVLNLFFFIQSIFEISFFCLALIWESKYISLDLPLTKYTIFMTPVIIHSTVQSICKLYWYICLSIHVMILV